MDFEEIRNLVKLMGEYNLTEVKIESETGTICFKRGDSRVAPPAPVAVPAPAAPVGDAPIEAAPNMNPFDANAGEGTSDLPF